MDKLPVEILTKIIDCKDRIGCVPPHMIDMRVIELTTHCII